jgi:hypothetical protein
MSRKTKLSSVCAAITIGIAAFSNCMSMNAKAAEVTDVIVDADNVDTGNTDIDNADKDNTDNANVANDNTSSNADDNNTTTTTTTTTNSTTTSSTTNVGNCGDELIGDVSIPDGVGPIPGGIEANIEHDGDTVITTTKITYEWTDENGVFYRRVLDSVVTDKPDIIISTTVTDEGSSVTTYYPEDERQLDHIEEDGTEVYIESKTDTKKPTVETVSNANKSTKTKATLTVITNSKTLSNVFYYQCHSKDKTVVSGGDIETTYTYSYKRQEITETPGNGEENPGIDNGVDTENPGTENGADTENPGTDNGADTENPGTENGADTENPGTDNGADTENPGTDNGADTENPGTDNGVDTENPGTENGADTENPGTDNGADTETPGIDNGADIENPDSGTENGTDTVNPDNNTSADTTTSNTTTSNTTTSNTTTTNTDTSTTTETTDTSTTTTASTTATTTATTTTVDDPSYVVIPDESVALTDGSSLNNAQTENKATIAPKTADHSYRTLLICMFAASASALAAALALRKLIRK